MYSKNTNGCSPYLIEYIDDKVEINFDFSPPWKPYKKFTLYANINEWDGGYYLDFSVIDLYAENLYKSPCNTLYIKKVDWMWILLEIGKTKILIPAYHHYIYYTSDIELVVEYRKYNESGEIIEEKIDKYDLNNYDAF